MVEIERKFLVTSDKFKNEAFKSSEIKQGYLNSHPERTTRIRIQDEIAFITIKGKSSKSGLSRFEWEKEIAVVEALELLKLCEPGAIEKVRYFVKSEEFTFEIDEFSGDNRGLVMAEIELTSEKDTFKKPDWLGEEVTGDLRYYNSQLSKNPFKNWI
ncbi:adenylate cyclase [Gillisia mitskevichiae]|uniref:Adenylate cyclase n=1 Tax=Gillisia mitskevichiae TaxID=270921 RepID=A0A495PWW0_9FLAO|nr:CYTH domain-containing protein [Gillisia mitskevichiae]RKS55298.1 adenylate cyclase [Gillisia mitskevichiae]